MSLRLLLSSHGASLFGAERVLLALAGGLAARGHEVTLELPHEGKAVPVAQRLERVQVVVTGRRRLPRNLTELARYAAGFPSGVRRLHALILHGRYDVVWANSLFNPVAALAARNTGAAVVWHLHERNFRGPAGLVAARWIAAHAKLALAPSRFVADSFVAAGIPDARLRVVPNALLTPFGRVPAAPLGRPFTVGYVGQFEPRKRATDVLYAVAQLNAARAVLIGDGKARSAVEAVRRRLRLEPLVRLTGFQDDVRPFLADCDCVVIPSRNEPFGLVALEALAAGLPVIAARSGALPEVLGDAALYYPLGDIRALADGLRRLRDEPLLTAQLRSRGADRLPLFSLDRMLDRVETVAQELVGRRAATAPARVHP